MGMPTKWRGNGNDGSRDDRDQPGTKGANSKRQGNDNDGSGRDDRNENHRDDTVTGSADSKD